MYDGTPVGYCNYTRQNSLNRPNAWFLQDASAVTITFVRLCSSNDVVVACALRKGGGPCVPGEGARVDASADWLARSSKQPLNSLFLKLATQNKSTEKGREMSA
jgi:hypothetical protein